MKVKEQFVQRDQHRIYALEYAGEEPTIILMHGFPDNLHLYDRLLPYLAPPRRIVTFDFLGWGFSDKPLGYPYTAKNQEGDLDAVVKRLELEQVVLVALDASGPPAIDWALNHSDQVAALVLLNTYYCAMPTLRPPEAIFLFSTPYQESRTAGLRSLESPDLPPNVLVASRKVLPGSGEEKSICPLVVSTIRCHAERTSSVF